MTAASLTEYFRTHINSFISAGGANFTPYVYNNVDDTQLFNQPGAASIGALVHIDLLINGTVLESDYKASTTAASFKFSTMESPLDSAHPVSGNREFGVYADPKGSGEFTFYTMGVDRTSTWVFALGNAFGSGFNSADALWTDMQTQMIDYINQHGGYAQFYNQHSYIARPNWDAVNDYLNGVIDLTTLKHRLGC